MADEQIAVDTQLLVLLVTGLASPTYIRNNKRLQGYTEGDFETLKRRLEQADRLIITASVLAEASNFLRNINEPGRGVVMNTFRKFIAKAHEMSAPAKEIAEASVFVRLGFSDTTLLALDDVSLLTADGPLYREALRQGRMAENFNHIREANQ